MKYLEFSNPGLIDPLNLISFGVSVKEQDSIGYFGTGLKYAIAIAVRNNIPITLFIGTEEYNFNTRPVSIRGTEIPFVTINDDISSFTTELGKTWKVWQLVRELYCNALDEHGDYQEVTEFSPEDGTTKFYLGITDSIQEVINEWSDYFISKDREPIYRDALIEIYEGQCSYIFYKGIRVRDLDAPTHYTYNILTQISLTEDRTATGSFESNRIIRNAVISQLPTEMIHSFMFAPEHTYEYGLHYSEDTYFKLSPQYKEVCRLHKDDLANINQSMIDLYFKVEKIPPTEKFTRSQLTNVQQLMLDRAKHVLKAAGYDITTHEIVTVTSLGTGVLGFADIHSDTIYLSIDAYVGGTKSLVATLLEEWIHLTTYYVDCTRQLQDYLLRQLVDAIEQIYGEPL